MIGRIIRIAVGVAVIGAAGLFAWLALAPGPLGFAGGKTVPLSQYRGPDPTGVPPSLRQASLVARGEYLTRAADCEACHTVPGGRPFAGGRAFVLPFGVIYSTNITSDRATGIGAYSDAQFVRMMRHGIRPDGQRLYPAMPYASYALMTDGDALAIKAYLSSLAPIRAPAPANTLRWPLSDRRLMAAWSWMFNPAAPFRPNTDRSPQWNRGAYLAEAMAHCGECHTPRNIGFALDNRRKFAGATIGGWRAFNISADKASGIGGWTDAALAAYLSTGFADGHGVATGPMGEAIDDGLSHLTSDDIRALVVYLRSVPPLAGDAPARVVTPADPSYRVGPGATADRTGEKVFAGACAACHGWTGISPVSRHATLTGVRSVNDPSATNVAQVVLFGVHRAGPDGMLMMPGFGHAYTDREIAAVANYVTARFGSKGSTLTERDVAKLRAQAGR